eukprot:scaffold4343_cov144-Cylindrotheca_fusiformis.AAC.25
MEDLLIKLIPNYFYDLELFLGPELITASNLGFRMEVVVSCRLDCDECVVLTVWSVRNGCWRRTHPHDNDLETIRLKIRDDPEARIVRHSPGP